MYLYINFSCHVPHNIWNHCTQPEWPTKNGSLGICIIPTAFHATKTWITILPLPTDLQDWLGKLYHHLLSLILHPVMYHYNIYRYIYIGIYTNIIYIHTWQLITTHWGYHGCGQTMIYPDSSQHKSDKQPTLDNSEPRVGNVPTVCVFLFCLCDDKKNVYI